MKKHKKVRKRKLGALKELWREYNHILISPTKRAWKAFNARIHPGKMNGFVKILRRETKGEWHVVTRAPILLERVWAVKTYCTTLRELTSWYQDFLLFMRLVDKWKRFCHRVTSSFPTCSLKFRKTMLFPTLFWNAIWGQEPRQGQINSLLYTKHLGIFEGFWVRGRNRGPPRYPHYSAFDPLGGKERDCGHSTVGL